MTVTYTPEDLDRYTSYILQDYRRMYAPGVAPLFCVTVTPGRKYLRVITVTRSSRSAHSFIDAAGLIWKAASWNAPAKNFPRGDIRTPDFSRVTWTGVH